MIGSVDCSDFESKFDSYVDAVLSPEEMAAAAAHVRCCERCNGIVTRYQETRVLLTMAVTERVAAVGVSGIWEAIESSLGPSPRVSWRERLAAVFEGLGAPWGGIPQLSPAWRVGAWVAMTAAVAIVGALALQPGDRTRVASSNGQFVPAIRIDSMEVAAGHTVATWIRPRSKTRVIWVSDPHNGFGFSNASLER